MCEAEAKGEAWCPRLSMSSSMLVDTASDLGRQGERSLIAKKVQHGVVIHWLLGRSRSGNISLSVWSHMVGWRHLEKRWGAYRQVLRFQEAIHAAAVVGKMADRYPGYQRYW